MFFATLETLDFKGKIGATGFEPATSRPPAVRATKLRHTPQQMILYQIFVKKQQFSVKATYTGKSCHTKQYFLCSNPFFSFDKKL